MNTSTEERYFRNPMLPYKEYKRIIYEPGMVARIKLDRPQYRNALSHALWGELEDALDRAGDDPDCQVVVLSGEGSCFSAGDDVIGLSPEGAPSLVDGAPPEELMKRYGSEKAVWHAYNIEHDYYPFWYPENKLHTFPKPTIAMVHGYCIFAAFILATNCDIIFASEDALFLGRSTRALYDLGPRKTLELLYEHRFMTAREAMEFHLVNRVYPNPEILEKECLAYANRVASQPSSVLRRYKEAFLRAMDVRGFSQVSNLARVPSWRTWQNWAEDGHPERSQGKGIARTPLALDHLKIKLESEGAEIPENVRAALARASARNDKATWRRALNQEWRDKNQMERAEAKPGSRRTPRRKGAPSVKRKG